MPPKAKRGSLAPWLHDTIEFYQHQVEGVRDLARRRSFLLADDMGLGKSLEALTVFTIDVVRGWAETCIIIAPPTLKGNWEDEIKKFTTFAYVLLDGTPDERIVQLFKYMAMKGPKILIINYEQASIHYDQLQGFNFDVAIFDEAHYIKNPLAKRTKSVLELRSRRSFMLTGTPMLNRVDELWGILHRIDPDKFPNFYSFVNRYAVYGGFQGKQVVGVKNEKELITKVQAVMLRRLKKDVLDLPEVQYIPRRVDLHPSQKAIYDECDLDFRLAWEKGKPGEESAEAGEREEETIEWAFVKFLRLRQICGTTLPFNGEDISAKLDLACEDDKELLANGEKIVVFTGFREVQSAYVARMKDLGVPTFAINGDNPPLERMAMSKEWAAVKGPALFVPMLQVASEGLTLTAARHGSFLDKWFNPGKNQQAVDRLHRIGADLSQPVQIREYLCRKTVETRIESINRSKKKLVESVIEDGSLDWKRKLIKMVMESGDDD